MFAGLVHAPSAIWALRIRQAVGWTGNRATTGLDETKVGTFPSLR